MRLDELALELPAGRIAGLRGGRRGARRVLALHGWLDNAAGFVPLAPHLGEVDLVAVDLPGHGHSAHLPAGAEYTPTEAVLAVLAIADALDWPRFTLLGHSLGAGIATLVAAAVPERIGAVAAIEALGPLSAPTADTPARLREAIQARRAAARPLRVFPDLATAVRARMLANHLDEADARLLVERGVRTVDGGLAWRTDPRLTLPTPVRLGEDQVRALLEAIACPVLAVFAEPAQPYFPEAQRRERLACLRHGRSVAMPGIHHLHLQHPAAVGGHVRAFFEALPADAAAGSPPPAR